jgi:hypothetical protein
MLLCHHCQILGERPILEAFKSSSDGALGVTSFLKALLKNLPQRVTFLHVVVVVAALQLCVLHASLHFGMSSWW